MRTLVCRAEANERGVAIVETVIVLPLFLFLLYGGLEYSRVLERAQWVSQLSRELVNVAFRECSTKTNPLLRSCIRERVIDPLTTQSDLLAPGMQYVVAVYSYESGTVTELEVTGEASYVQRFRDAGFTVAKLTQEANARTSGSSGNALRESGSLVVGVAYSPMKTFVRRILPGFRYLFPEVISSTTQI